MNTHTDYLAALPPFPARPLHSQLLDMDEHATLWPALEVRTRHVEGAEDVTIGMHPDLGLCVVSHYGFASLVEWSTRKPIPDALLD